MKPSLIHKDLALLYCVFVHWEKTDAIPSPDNHFLVTKKTTLISAAAIIKCSGNSYLNGIRF